MGSFAHGISSDMIFEIMSRTCLRTLDSSRLVCKEWNNLTYDPNFVQTHVKNTNIVSGYLVQSLVRTEYKSQFVLFDGQGHNPSSNHALSFEFLQKHDFKIEACSDQLGIFVLDCRQHYRHPRYYICKPSTKQLVMLPNPKLRFRTEKVALLVLSASPLRYKIIRLSMASRWLTGFVTYRCEIFDSDIWAWKESKDILLPHCEILSADPAICASGSINFRTINDRVVVFEVNSETHKIFPLPQPAFENFAYKDKQIVKYNGRLGFSCKAPNGCLELWIMNKFGTNQPLWEKRLVWTTEVLEEKIDYPVLKDFYNSGVVVVKSEKRVIFYNIENHHIYQVKVDHHPRELFAFRSDFEPINLNNRQC